MFDLKSFLKKGVEKELTDIEDYMFMPENVQLEVDQGRVNCVLNGNGTVDIFYSKLGVTHASAAVRKHPLTSFETELHHGVYDDIIDDLVDQVNDTLDGKSKYFRDEVVLPATNTLEFSSPSETNHTP